LVTIILAFDFNFSCWLHYKWKTQSSSFLHALLVGRFSKNWGSFCERTLFQQFLLFLLLGDGDFSLALVGVPGFVAQLEPCFLTCLLSLAVQLLGILSVDFLGELDVLNFHELIEATLRLLIELGKCESLCPYTRLGFFLFGLRLLQLCLLRKLRLFLAFLKRNLLLKVGALDSILVDEEAMGPKVENFLLEAIVVLGAQLNIGSLFFIRHLRPELCLLAHQVLKREVGEIGLDLLMS